MLNLIRTHCRLALGGMIAMLAGGALHASQNSPGLPVVELFQSQGCSSCPPANANVNALIAKRPDVLALSFSVDYWDDLGWKDTFARPAYTARQRDYARGLKHANVATPQVVINGRKDVVGFDARELDRAIATTAAPTRGVTLNPNQAMVGAGPAPDRPVDVWLVRYDPRVLNVPIKRGENSGRTLPHRNIVKELTKLGSWRGSPATFALPKATDLGLKTAVLVQAPGGPILAAAHD